VLEAGRIAGRFVSYTLTVLRSQRAMPRLVIVSGLNRLPGSPQRCADAREAERARSCLIEASAVVIDDT
jgi:hypothetical protein